MVTNQLFKKALEAEDIDLAKLGWTEAKDDKEIFSYIRGFVWRSYGIRIKEPLDFVIKVMLDEAMATNDKLNSRSRNKQN